MKLHQLAANLGVVAAGLLAVSSAPAQAFSFTTNLGTNNSPKGNVLLDSVTLEDGTVFSDFVFVEGATISNPPFMGGNSGAASVDRGDNADGLAAEDPTPAEVVGALANLNLNNIIDTEDAGDDFIDLTFAKAVNTLFLWERGMNSRLGIQALDSSGALIGDRITLDSKTFDYAGYDIDTTEINKAQRVGSRGISLADLGLTDGTFFGIRAEALGAVDNGPDYKVLAGLVGAEEPTATPEPSELVGLGLIAGVAFTLRRRYKSELSA